MNSSDSFKPQLTNATPNDMPIEVIDEKTLLHDKWLGVRQITYRHRHQSTAAQSDSPAASDISKLPVWQVAYRPSKPKTAKVDGVSIIATLIKTSVEDKSRKEKFLVLVKQFRIPLMKYSLEFPAGLLDPNETALEAGLRELKEETGYTATKVLGVTAGIQSLDPGMTDDSINFVLVEIDSDSEENRGANVQQKLDNDERIEVVLVPFDRILESFRCFTKEGICVEGMVYAFGLGTIFKNGRIGEGLVL